MRMIVRVLLTAVLLFAFPRGEADGGTLTVQSTSLTPASWDPVYSADGTGNLMDYTDPLTDPAVLNQPAVFYRIGAQ